MATILNHIGNTPCVQLQQVVPEGCARVYLKLENLNPTGSYKDRMAYSLIEQAEKSGTLQPNMTVVEATGGSTGSSLALVCAVKGYKFHVISSDAFSTEKLRTMTAFGANLELVESPSKQVTPSLFPTMVQRARSICQKDGYFLANQFENPDILVGYGGLGKELVQEFPDGIDAFCGAVGSAGMVMGVSKVLKSQWPKTRVVILEPASAPTITEGRNGAHHVEGIGIGRVPPLLNSELYDEAGTVREEDARLMCRRLAKEEGLLVGTSTGLNVTAAIRLAKELGPGKTVVTVACDTGLKYMSGDLFA